MKNVYVKPAMRYSKSLTGIIPAALLGAAVGAVGAATAASSLSSALSSSSSSAFGRPTPPIPGRLFGFDSGIFSNRECLPALDEVRLCR